MDDSSVMQVWTCIVGKPHDSPQTSPKRLHSILDSGKPNDSSDIFRRLSGSVRSHMGHTSGKNNLEHCAMPWHHLLRMHFTMEAIEIGFYCFFFSDKGHWMFCDIYVWEKFYHNTHRLYGPNYASINTPWHKILDHIVHRDILCFCCQHSCQYLFMLARVQVVISWPTESEQNYLHIYISIQYVIATSKFFPRDTHVLHTNIRTLVFKHRKPFQH